MALHRGNRKSEIVLKFLSLNWKNSLVIVVRMEERSLGRREEAKDERGKGKENEEKNKTPVNN